MKNVVIQFAAVFFLCSVYSTAGADTRVLKVFKCQGEKIQNGDTTYSVLKKCGEPAFKEVLSTEESEREEKWHYDCYGRGYVDELIFRKGVLVERMRGVDSQGTHECK